MKPLETSPFSDAGIGVTVNTEGTLAVIERGKSEQLIFELA
jgi:hypothetical protein